MKRAIWFLVMLAAVTLVAAVSASAQTVTVSGSIGKGVANRGGSTRTTVVMNIPGGLHVNSNRPGSEYAIPTTVRVSGEGFKAGPVSYPRGRSRTFAFSDSAISVYEGRTSFSFDVKVPSNFRGNLIRVRAVVRYQACTNEVCYPPTSKTVNLTARVQ